MDTKTNNSNMEEVGGRIVRISLEEALKPTQRQLNIIADIERYCGGEFKGKTKQEATKFISTYKKDLELEYELEAIIWESKHGDWGCRD